MIERRGNLWTYPADWRVITTNGYVRKDGCAVMGRGCAYEAAQKFIMLPSQLGRKLRKQGNHVHLFPDIRIITFPVKHAWDQDADLALIERSVRELLQVLDPKQRYVMPRPGCGNGRLGWNTVRPLLEPLPHNVTVITWA